MSDNTSVTENKEKPSLTEIMKALHIAFPPPGNCSNAVVYCKTDDGDYSLVISIHTDPDKVDLRNIFIVEKDLHSIEFLVSDIKELLNDTRNQDTTAD